MSVPSSQEARRKRPEPNGVVYSQPSDTGTGLRIQTQIHYALQYMKNKDVPVSFMDVFDYLSVPNATEENRREIEVRLQTHPLVDYNANQSPATFRFRPKHGVRSKDELEAFLQKQTTAKGIPVNELKEGWPGAIDAIEELNRQGKLLMVRHKKEQTPKFVWSDDASLHHKVDNEFQSLFHEAKVPPNTGDLRKELIDFGLTPTSQVKAVAPVKEKEKKRKKGSTRSGKTTNTHMTSILKDFSHMRNT